MPEATTPRMEQLQKLLAREPNDPFLIYGLALEWKKAGNPKQAIELLDRVIAIDPSYCYAYFQQGQIHESAGNIEAAKAIYRKGIDAARQKGDNHALSELQAALMDIE